MTAKLCSRPFEPLFNNPHVLTILGNFWPRKYSWEKFPISSRYYQTDATTQVLVQTQSPAGAAKGELVLLHGLEGSGQAGYIQSMAWDGLRAGYVVHRFHMRSCGDTAHLCQTLYHGGLTSDLQSFLVQRRVDSALPMFLVGFSLGGNIALKLAGELGETALIQGVAGVSVPIDLGASSRRIGALVNRVYERRFLKRMRARVLSTGRYTKEQVDRARTLWEMDDQITAPSFGFGTAENYYATQSAVAFLDRIRVPTIVVQAKDDSYIPFEIFGHAAFRTNPYLRLVATEHGGHIGFLHRHAPRFWADEVVLEFLDGVVGRL